MAKPLSDVPSVVRPLPGIADDLPGSVVVSADAAQGILPPFQSELDAAWREQERRRIEKRAHDRELARERSRRYRARKRNGGGA